MNFCIQKFLTLQLAYNKSIIFYSPRKSIIEPSIRKFSKNSQMRLTLMIPQRQINHSFANFEKIYTHFKIINFKHNREISQFQLIIKKKSMFQGSTLNIFLYQYHQPTQINTRQRKQVIFS